jgi:hypothetical protein
VPTRHQRSWSRRLFHSAQSIRLLETEPRFHSNIQISFDQTKVGSLPLYGFRGVYVFDTQTEGADLPE